MNAKPIGQARNPLLAAALPALLRARQRAEETAIATNTALVQVIDGKVVRFYPRDDRPRAGVEGAPATSARRGRSPAKPPRAPR